jgi:hypothetical protein
MEGELPFFHLDQAEREGDHVILCSTFEFLFEFQNRIFLEFFVRVSSCSNIKPFEVRGSTVFHNILSILQTLCDIYLISKTSDPALGPKQTPLQHVPVAFSPEADGWGVNLTTYLHIVPRLRMTGGTPSFFCTYNAVPI